jgi:hypothetical protein
MSTIARTAIAITFSYNALAFKTISAIFKSGGDWPAATETSRIVLNRCVQHEGWKEGLSDIDKRISEEDSQLASFSAHETRILFGEIKLSIRVTEASCHEVLIKSAVSERFAFRLGNTD